MGSYQLLDRAEFALERLPEFFEALKPVDYVVYRGMHALMKADMLSRYREFWEEATTACYVALDTSFSVIQRRLREEGIEQPSAVLAQHGSIDTSMRPEFRSRDPPTSTSVKCTSSGS